MQAEKRNIQYVGRKKKSSKIVVEYLPVKHPKTAQILFSELKPVQLPFPGVLR